MQFKIKATAVVTLEHTPGSTTSRHLRTDFTGEVSNNLSRAEYVDAQGNPTPAGSQAITHCFIQGLVANIHLAHKQGWRNDAEHLRHIISELERGFATPAKVDTGIMS